MKIDKNICKSCGQVANCRKGQVEGIEFDDVLKYLVVIAYPEKEDDVGKVFKGPRAKMVIDTIPDIDEFPESKYVGLTYMVKCPTYKDTIIMDNYAEPSQNSIDHCLKHLEAEIKANPGVIVIGLGNLVCQTLLQNKDFKITVEAGVKKRAKIGDTEFVLYPSLEPGQLMKTPSLIGDVKNHYLKAYRSANREEVADTSHRFQILDFKGAMEKMEETIDLYKSGKIKYTLFDIENTVGLDVHQGGEINMTSIGNSLTQTGYSIPLYVDNTIHHWRSLDKDHPSFKVQVQDYKSSNPINFGYTKKHDKSWELVNFDYEIPFVDFDITPQQKAKLKVMTAKMLTEVPISGHNLKYDLKWLAYENWVDIRKIKIYIDSNNWAFQWLNKGQDVSLTLKDLSRKFLTVVDDWESEIQQYLDMFRFTVDRHFGKLPTGLLGRYSALDSYYNVKLVDHFVENMPESLQKAARMVDRAIVPYADTESKGIGFKMDMMKELDDKYTVYMDSKRARAEELPKVSAMISKYVEPLIEENAKKKKPKPMEVLRANAFNFNNPAKVSELTYHKDYYGLTVGKDYVTKKDAPQFSKDARKWILENQLAQYKLDELKTKKPERYEHLMEAKEWVQIYSSWKRISKLRTDYIRSMPNSMTANIYYSSFNLNGTTTGRLSSPFHSMPKGCDIKRVVTSRWLEEGGLVLAADYSQLELRVVAALSGEKAFIEAFAKGVDPHAFTASMIYKIAPDKVTKQQRDVGKTTNFAMLYGKGVENLAVDLNMSVNEAQAILDSFYGAMTELTRWMKREQKKVHATGYVETVFGRRIPVHSVGNQSQYAIAETDRLAVNYPVQSAASDIVYNNVVDIWYEKEKQGLKSIFLASIHDSIEYDVYPGELFKMTQVLMDEGVNKNSEKYPWLVCPLALSAEYGATWGGALEAHMEEYSSSHIKFRAKGLRKDFNDLIKYAEKAYSVDVTLTGKKKLEPKDFKDDIMVRDVVEWEGDVYLSQK